MKFINQMRGWNWACAFAGALVISLSISTALGQVPQSGGDEKISLNFKDVPLESVLEYLSEAAGYVILADESVTGNVTVISKQTLNKEEALDLLDTILNEKGYTAVRRGTNGRILKIVRLDDAPSEDLPVISGGDPDLIPKKDVMVTQIIPIRFGNAKALIENISALLPEYSTISANESSNSLILTDTQANINRIAQIVKALDDSISGVTDLKVFPLSYADAKEIETVIKGIFEPQTSNSGRSSSRSSPFEGGFPFSRGGDRGERGSSSRSGGNSAALAANSRVVAIAEERSNSLVISAPVELMDTISKLIAEMDRNVEDITEIRVYPLKFADAYEMSEILTSLFSDEDEIQNSRSGFRFGPGGVFGRGGDSGRSSRGGGGETNESNRMLQQKKVVAVADPRTNSVIVSASSELMGQISRMITQLDANSSKKQNVYTYTLDHGDIYGVADILRNMFEQQNGNFNNNTANRNNQTRNNPLQNRSVGTNTGFGQGGGGGNARGGGF